jgi:ABC-type molybdate transport system substrate-binding protein
MKELVRGFTCSSVVALAGLVAVACGDDAAAAAANPACDPAGKYDLARGEFTGEGGKVCTDSAMINNTTTKAVTIVIAKNADGTFSVNQEGQSNDDTKFTLDAAKCELKGTKAPQTFPINQPTGVIVMGKSVSTETLTVNTAAKTIATLQVGEVTSEPPSDGTPCTLTAKRTGTKK